MNSKFGKINLEELSKGLVIIVVGSILTLLLKSIEAHGLSLTSDDLMQILTGGVTAGLAYIVKTVFQTETGDQLGGLIRFKK